MKVRMVAVGGLITSLTLCCVPAIARAHPALIIGGSWGGIAVSGGNLFATDFFFDKIEQFTTSGVIVNPALVTGLNRPGAIAVVPTSVSDLSSAWTLLLLSLTAIYGIKLMLGQQATKLRLTRRNLI